MVAGKVKAAMGFQKSSASPARANSKQETPQQRSPLPSGSSGKGSQKAMFSRSFGVYFPRASAQVQPRPPDVTELLRVVEELRERESLLKTELLEHKLLKETVAIVPVLENEIDSKNLEIERNVEKIEALEDENSTLKKEVEELKVKAEEERIENEERMMAMQEEIVVLKNRCLEYEELSSSQRIQGLVEVSGRSNLIKSLRRGISSKCTDVSGGSNQETRGNIRKGVEVCYQRDEGDVERPRHSTCDSEEFISVESSSDSALSHIRSRVPRVPKPPPIPSSSVCLSLSSSPTLSPSFTFTGADNNGMKQQIGEGMQTQLPFPPPPPPPPQRHTVKVVPPPPPPPGRSYSKTVPPPPPPPPKGTRGVPARVRRVPEVAEFYHSLMRRDSRKDPSGCVTEVPSTANARDMIGEIENRSAHLLAIKTDIETQGDFIRFLIKEVDNAAFTDIEDVVPFVKWLDDELSYLVDERAVLKHFNWPEHKADALREAAFGYCDLKKLVSEASSFRDDTRQPCGPALKKMQALFEKLEHCVYNLSRMTESAARRYKVFQIPTDWMLDTGYVSQIKLASVKLAMKYMKRVSAELGTVGGAPEEEELIVQGVRFAFRVHQFAGGFDVETMKAFQELRDKARSCHVECQNHQQKLVCRHTC